MTVRNGVFFIGGNMESTTRKLHNLKNVSSLLDMSAPTIYRRIKNDPNFPKPHLVGGNNFWTDAQINDYIERIESGCYSS